MNIKAFNQMSDEDAKRQLSQCCAASLWVASVANARPFDSAAALLDCAESAWQNMDECNLLQAFEAHPQIGDINSLRQKYAATKKMAAGEQNSVNDASESVLTSLVKGNQDYLNKFGFIFIVFASGKSAAQMLSLLQTRLVNSRTQELENAAAEQNKITLLRLKKLFSVAH